MTSNASRNVIAGRYELNVDEPLGSGGMATVYKGRDLRARRDVAIKTLRPEYQADPDSRRRFRQEARMMAFVSHPNLVSIYDLHEESSGSWVIMELVPGRNLKQIIETNGTLSLDQVLGILDQVAQALGHLHERKLVHLDIKPQNLIVMPNGVVKLIDFGLAQPAGPRQQMIGGTAFGSVAYLAPEQASGEPVDSATDVYALGCVVYELLTGQPPFTVAAGPDHKRELIHAHLELLPVAPSVLRPDLNIPSWVDDVIGWSLAKSKEERFHDAPTFARMFRSGLEGDLLPNGQRTSQLSDEDEGHTRTIPTRRSPSRRRVDEDDFTEDAGFETDGPTVASRLYRIGGRAARRTRPIHLTLWKIALVFALGNLLLAIVLLTRNGPSALVEHFLAVAPGTTTEIAIDDLNLRTGPGVGFEVIAVLPEGTDVRVTGLSESNDEGQWWPVELERDGSTQRGWVWADGLRPNEWTGRLSWIQGIVERGRSITDGIGDGVDAVTGVWPFSIDPWAVV